MSKRQPGGQFAPGKSGNPGGRSRAQAEMARMIREGTREGKDLVEFALRVWRGDEVDMSSEKSRTWAHEWLTERGFGKVVQVIETQGDTAAPLPDLSSLSLDDLRRIAAGEDEDEPPHDGAAENRG